MATHFSDLLHPQRLIEVVDVGANPVDGDPPYKPLLDAGLCHVTGFEPQSEALAELQKKSGIYERYLPYAVGDGSTHTLNICSASGMSSLLEPDAATLAVFEALKETAEITERIPFDTRKLDDIAEITHLDFLKIDVQGSELAIFQGGRNKLAQTVAIQTEVPFVTLYKNQPSLGDIDVELRSQGYIPHCFAALKQCPIAPCVINNNPRQPLRQLLEADLVYVKDFTRPELIDDEQLKHLAMIAHYCYGSFDLALRCVMLLEQRKIIAADTQARYLQIAISPA
jgi:FkbM family methyltransferase